MKTIPTLLLLVLISAPLAAQKDLTPTTSFVIQGEVQSAVTITAADLVSMNIKDIGDVVITNHLGERKSEAKALKGVLLKDVLKKVQMNAESPKILSEYYFVCKANDGYTVVYSWNEIFNAATGDHAFIVTEKNGKRINEMSDAILMICPTDIATGRRHVKSLASIDVRRAGK